MAKRKRKSLAALMNDAASLLQKLVRVKAADREGYCRCVTCGRVGHWTEMDGGHFISRRWTSTKLLEENVNPQCKPCNLYLRGNMVAYTLYMIDMRGKEFVEWLEQEKHAPTKWRRPDLEDFIDELRGRITEVMAEKGL